MNGIASYFLNANGVRSHALVGGGGQSILLLHGLTDWARVWEPAFGNLSGRLIAPDLRGHGLSQKPRRGYSLSDFVADAADLVIQLNAAPAVVLGHSFGGIIALTAASTCPELFCAAIIVDSSLEWRWSRTESFLAQVAVWRALAFPKLLALHTQMYPDWSERDIIRRVQGLKRFSPRCATGLQFENYDHSLEPMYAYLRCPTLLIAGVKQRGSVLSRADLERITQLSPHVCVKRIPRAGHSVQREQPQAFWKIVRGFLSESQIFSSFDSPSSRLSG